MQGPIIKPEEEQKPSRSSKHKHNSLNDSQAIKIVEEVDRLLCKGDNLESINLLRALRENMQAVKNPHLTTLILANLGILYYQVGFLQQAQLELAAAISRLKQLSSKTLSSRNKDFHRIRYDTIAAKLQLQLCILYSQMGKHSQALQHAKNSSRMSYNLVIQLLTRLHQSLHLVLKREPHPASKQENHTDKQQGQYGKQIIGNNISVLQHLLSTTRDLKLAFAQKEILYLLDEQTQQTRKLGWVNPKIDLEQLYRPQERQEHLWIYRNKILDEIQLTPFDVSELQEGDTEVSSSDIIQKITYLAISLYCYSTETRFIQKQQQCDSHDVLDSEHWLSRSLQIAYCFLPPEAPILNQIITVHDRFHGLDKQTIPEDQQVTGFFKVLRPLSKPKSTYSNKSPGSSPIMIRIQSDKVAVQLPPGIQLHPASKTYRQFSNNSMPQEGHLIQLDRPNQTLDIQGLARNNKIRNYSHGHRRVETTDTNLVGKPSMSARTTIETSHPNVRANYASKKFARKKEERLRVNLSELNGKALLSEDLLGRPSSIEQKVKEGKLRSYFNEKRKKSLPTRKSEQRRVKEQQTLQLKGKRMDEGQVETRVLGGNVYINNNINLFISRGESFGQTFIRGQVRENRREQGRREGKDKDEGSRRQMFLNRRRANNFIDLE